MFLCDNSLSFTFMFYIFFSKYVHLLILITEGEKEERAEGREGTERKITICQSPSREALPTSLGQQTSCCPPNLTDWHGGQPSQPTHWVHADISSPGSLPRSIGSPVARFRVQLHHLIPGGKSSGLTGLVKGLCELNACNMLRIRPNTEQH